jgi:hypothetical protein
MYSGKYVFSQVLEFVSQYEFNKCVKRYNGNYRVHELDCWNQFLQVLFGQLASKPSLRSISVCLKAHSHQLYHLGIKRYVDSSVLSRANERRDWQIFADFGNYLIQLVRPLYAKSPIPNIDIDNEIFALDSTTISVSINLFTWAEGKYSRGAVKMHTLINLRGSIPEFIYITDGKYHDSNALDVINFYASAIYLMDKAYVDFEALCRINSAGAFFVSRAKETMRYSIVEQNFNIDETTVLSVRKPVVSSILKFCSTMLYRIVPFALVTKNAPALFIRHNASKSTYALSIR